MKIFISWSGERSQALADAMREWLPLVLHFAKPWFSTSDIKSGDRWGVEIAKELQDTNFGILCVTKDNLDAPWLLFEAGALAKSIEEGRVIPLLLDLEKSDLSGPLTHFQAEKVDGDGIGKLVASLNKAASSPIVQDTLQALLDSLWPRLEKKIADIPASDSPNKKSRPQSEILEELVSGVRSVEMRVRDAMEEGPDSRNRRRRRFHPGLVLEVSHRIADGANDPIRLLILASPFKDQIPWLYELALEAYRAIRAGDSDSAHSAYRRFFEAAEALRHGPGIDFFMDDKMSYMMLSDCLEYLSSFAFEVDTDSKKLTQKKGRAVL